MLGCRRCNHPFEGRGPESSSTQGPADGGKRGQTTIFSESADQDRGNTENGPGSIDFFCRRPDLIEPGPLSVPLIRAQLFFFTLSGHSNNAEATPSRSQRTLSPGHGSSRKVIAYAIFRDWLRPTAANARSGSRKAAHRSRVMAIVTSIIGTSITASAESKPS